ncbi:hypothetical protein THAOC_20475 [Thalassiosira oceanica]|uniref:F-box domain-containing protein n=1 Tax=Thalassiosira oceanica TaxID=159749 RepID=K0S3B2_THAOC|nr:hypothetical protein THAOC_20475 [Thalassiosira oceanica]|eukprot:EJK59319.1 hypothetical protein THAOC_20475 [Thalassiosira oceanica]
MLDRPADPLAPGARRAFDIMRPHVPAAQMVEDSFIRREAGLQLAQLLRVLECHAVPAPLKEAHSDLDLRLEVHVESMLYKLGTNSTPRRVVFKTTDFLRTGRGDVERGRASSAMMADDDGAKRLNTSQDAVAIAEVAELRDTVAELRRRNAELESEIEKLRSDNAQLRRSRPSEVPEGVRQLEGNHEVLPVVIVPSTVDLSRVDSSIVAHITSFLGTPRELLNLALSCKSFGWSQPVSTLNWSLVEEVARQAVFLRATGDEVDYLPHYASSTTTWLSILYIYEHLLDFDVLLGCYIEHRNGDKTAICATGHRSVISSVAVSSSYIMKSGAHYAEFLITGTTPCIGIVRPMPGLDAGAYQKGGCSFVEDSRFSPDFLAQRSDEWGNGNVHACEYYCGDGEKFWTDWVADHSEWEDWEGMEDCETGDIIGMLLNLVEGTLTVYKNNRRLGVMKDGLSGSYCWYAGVSQDGDTVAIIRAHLPTTARSSPN